MSYARNIRLLELHSVFLNALFCVPVLIPFYRDEIGLSFRDFLIGESVFAAVLILLEVPSGWLSDIWKRKHVLALSSVFWIVGLSILLLAENLLHAVLAQGIIGVSVSLFSGTNSAMLYDTLLAEGRTEEYSRLEGRRQGVGLYTVALTGIGGGFLYDL